MLTELHKFILRVYVCSKLYKHYLSFVMCSSLHVAKVSSKVYPKKHYVPIGETVEFVCVSTNLATWTFGKHDLPKNAYVYNYKGSCDSWLRIINVQLANAGVYWCVDIDKTNQKYQDSGMLYVGNT